MPTPGQVLLQALQGREAQPPLQLATVPLLGCQHLAQSDNFLLHLQKHGYQDSATTMAGSDHHPYTRHSEGLLRIT